jgi:hypothetical protein
VHCQLEVTALQFNVLLQQQPLGGEQSIHLYDAVSIADRRGVRIARTNKCHPRSEKQSCAGHLFNYPPSRLLLAVCSGGHRVARGVHTVYVFVT